MLPDRSIPLDGRPFFGDVRNSILCGFAVVVAIALTGPIVNSPFDDDWSYSFTVKQLLLQHRLVYNGWASASLIVQAYWGYLWVSVFGFSYAVLRFSTLPLAGAAISLCFLLARRAGLQPRFAVFATLLVGLSPVYLPLACTFMTDAPGFFFIMLSIYGFSRAIDSPRTAKAVSWLLLGIIAGLIGGTGRQIVWLAPLVFAPYTAWLRRDNFAIAVTAMLGWIAVIAGAALTLHWFANQPLAIPEMSLHEAMHRALHEKAHYIIRVISIGLTLLWIILPAMWGLIRGWTAPRALLALLIFIGPVLLLVKARPAYALAPWMGNCLWPEGALGSSELTGIRPTVMPFVIRMLSAVAVYAVLSALGADALLWLARPQTAARKSIRFFLHPLPGEALLPGMILFVLGYVLLLLPRCATDMVYDRYMIPLMPCVLFPLLLGWQRQGYNGPPKFAWILLGIYAAYGICITEDVNAIDRARAAAMQRLADGNIPHTEIVAGFEMNYQTQLDAAGYVNDRRIQNPKNAYKPGLGPTYAIHPKYRLEYAPAIDTAPTEYGSVSYFSYLYPFHREIFIDRFIDPYWLNPREAATRPSHKYGMTDPAGLPEDGGKK